MASLAKAIRQNADSDDLDLEGYGPAGCEELAAHAFKEPITCTQMIRFALHLICCHLE